MKTIHMTTVIVIGACIALSACSSTGNKKGNMFGQTGTTDSGMVTQGLGNASQVYGENVYATTTNAPANQSYFYDFDKSQLHDNAYASIDAQANYLIAHPDARVLLAGNTDARGSREYNIALGERRDLSVVERLKMDGVKPSQIRTISYGAEKPVALGQTDADYAKNRRVDLTYLVS